MDFLWKQLFAEKNPCYSGPIGMLNVRRDGDHQNQDSSSLKNLCVDAIFH